MWIDYILSSFCLYRGLQCCTEVLFLFLKGHPLLVLILIKKIFIELKMGKIYGMIRERKFIKGFCNEINA